MLRMGAVAFPVARTDDGKRDDGPIIPNACGHARVRTRERHILVCNDATATPDRTDRSNPPIVLGVVHAAIVGVWWRWPLLPSRRALRAGSKSPLLG
jgi:hypothetical protein